MSEKQSVRILVVDDEHEITNLVCRWLEVEKYDCETANSGAAALELLGTYEFHLVITDIMMPGMSGIELLRVIRELYPDVAVIMATAVSERDTAVTAVELGAYGYLIKPFNRNDMTINVANALERRRLTLASQEYERTLEAKVELRTRELRLAQEEIIHRLIFAFGFRDEETGAHLKRIGLYCHAMTQGLGWGSQSVNDIKLAAPMHDVGKIGIPDAILRKPGKLTMKEIEVMKTHTTIGGRILADSEIPLMRLAHDIALSHHERWDGLGYPRGQNGSEIPVCGRIVAIVDVYDALVHKRVYKPAFCEEEAFSIMSRGKGSHFDPELLEVFLEQTAEMRRIREEVKDEEESQGNPRLGPYPTAMPNGGR